MGSRFDTPPGVVKLTTPESGLGRQFVHPRSAVCQIDIPYLIMYWFPKFRKPIHNQWCFRKGEVNRDTLYWLNKNVRPITISDSSSDNHGTIISIEGFTEFPVKPTRWGTILPHPLGGERFVPPMQISKGVTKRYPLWQGHAGCDPARWTKCPPGMYSIHTP